MQEYDLENSLETFVIEELEAATISDIEQFGGCLYTAGRLDAFKEIWDKINDKS